MKHPLPCMFVAVGMAASSAHAIEADVEVGYRALYTDNTRQAANNETSELIHAPRARLTLFETGKLELESTYEAERRIYTEDVFDDDTVTTGRTSLDYHARPYLDLRARHSRTEGLADSRLNNIQSNRQVLSTIGAGATAILPGVGTGRTLASYDYTDRSADRFSTDSVVHSVGLRHTTGREDREFTVGLTVGQTDYDNAFVPDYDTRAAFVQLMNSTTTLDLNLTLGITSLEIEDDLGPTEDQEEPTVEATATYRPSDVSTLVFSGSHTVEDRSVFAEQGVREFGERFDDDGDFAQVFVNTNLGVTYSHQLGRTDFTISASHTDQDYKSIERDQVRTTIRLTADRAIRPTLRGRASIYSNEIDFRDAGRTDEEIVAEVVVDWEHNPRLRSSWGAGFETQDSTSNGQEFDEMFAYVSLSYSVTQPR